MKHIVKFNESLDDISKDIIDYLETWPDEYSTENTYNKYWELFKICGVKELQIRGDISSFSDVYKKSGFSGPGKLISVEYILPQVLWQDSKIMDVDFIETQIKVLNRIKTLLKRIEILGGHPICEYHTYISYRLRSIFIKVFISSNTP